MAQRPIWRGHLRLALVSCPVALYTARHERNAIRFNMINPKTGNRIKMVTQDAERGEPLSRSDTVKGYEFNKPERVSLFGLEGGRDRADEVARQGVGRVRHSGHLHHAGDDRDGAAAADDA